jgi:hypothetical protein
MHHSIIAFVKYASVKVLEASLKAPVKKIQRMSIMQEYGMHILFFLPLIIGRILIEL